MTKKKQDDYIVSDQENDETYIKTLEYLKVARAYIEIRIENNRFKFQDEPTIIEPAPLVGLDDSFEYVYPIFDFGDRLIASKQSDVEISNQSMLKMYYTIEKMVAIWHEKLKSGEDGGEVLLYLDGHLYCMRKAFEVIINVPDNWVIMNFDPEAWGQQYLASLNRLREKNFNFPPPAPRDIYKNTQAYTHSKQQIKK